LKTKGRGAEKRAKRGQREGKERGKRLQPADSTTVVGKSATQRALRSEHRDHGGVELRAMRMIVKIKRLEVEQFVTF